MIIGYASDTRIFRRQLAPQKAAIVIGESFPASTRFYVDDAEPFSIMRAASTTDGV